MARDHAHEAYRAEIDRRLGEALDAAATDCLAPARTAIAESDDRWDGHLLVSSYEAVSDRAAIAPALEAAVAIELLREYYRSRCELLARVTGGAAGSPKRDLTPALLRGDHLYTSAYSALEGIDTVRRGACFETLASVSETMIEAFDSATSGAPSADGELCTFIDRTAGALGQGAATVGVLLADGDSSRRARFETLGRSLGTARQIRLVLDSDADPVRLPAFDVDERRLRQHAERRRAEAERALSDLSTVVEVDGLRAVVESIADREG